MSGFPGEWHHQLFPLWQEMQEIVFANSCPAEEPVVLENVNAQFDGMPSGGN